MRKIAVITGARADYGLLYWIIKGISEDSEFQLQLIVACMHLSPDFGLTIRAIEKDGFPIAEKVEMLLSGDTESAIAISMGLGVIGFAKAYERLKPDILLVLGDRFEILSAVATAIPFRIIVAHISGGESTEGLIDEPIRHAITKMSHFHFTTTEFYRKRVIQMGENPRNVYNFGAPGIDSIYKFRLFDKGVIIRKLGIPAKKRIGVVTFHPVTLENNTAGQQVKELLEAVKEFPGIYWIFTFANADTGGRIIIKEIEKFVKENIGRGEIFISLGQILYLSLLKHADLMLGNSSSGLVEAPSFKLPVVNIGDRQCGRIRAKNVIDVSDCCRDLMVKAIRKAVNDKFRKSLDGINNPYGSGNASNKIVRKLKNISLNDKVIKKKFFDINQ